MDAQNTMAAELYNTLNAENKEKVKNLIATLLSQQLDDQQSPDLQA
jgi:hypothetical protein